MLIDWRGALKAGYTEKDIYEYGLKQGLTFDQIAKQLEPYYKEQADPTKDMSGFEKFMAGAGKAVVDTGRGIGQLIGMVDEEDVKKSRELDRPLMETGAGQVGNVAGHLATALLPGAALKAGGAVKAGQALMAPETIKGAAALGAGLGFIQPAESTAERVASTALGGLTSGVGQKVGQYIGQGISRPAGKAAQQYEARARKLGMKTTPGQSTRSDALMRMEASAQSYPPTAGAFAGIRENNQQVLNKAVAKSIGQNADELTENVMDDAFREIGNKFNAVEAVDFIPLGSESGEAVDTLIEDYIRVIGGKGATKSKQLIQDFAEKINEGGFTGKWYKRSRSALGREIKSASRAGDINTMEVAQGLTEILDDAAEKSIPSAIKDSYMQARSQYRNLIAATKSLIQPGSPDVSGPKLATELNRMYGSRYLRGQAPNQDVKDLFDLTKFVNTHRQIVGDSGTATRMALPQMLTTGALGAGAGYGLSGGDPGSALMGAVALPLAARVGLGGYLSAPSQAMIRQGGLEGLGMQGAGAAMRGLGTYLPSAYLAQ